MSTATDLKKAKRAFIDQIVKLTGAKTARRYDACWWTDSRGWVHVIGVGDVFADDGVVRVYCDHFDLLYRGRGIEPTGKRGEFTLMVDQLLTYAPLAVAYVEGREMKEPPPDCPEAWSAYLWTDRAEARRRERSE